MSAPEFSPDLIEKTLQQLDIHRWKSMGVSSIECECGEILYGDESMSQFPADEAFRLHLAHAILSAVSEPLRDEGAIISKQAVDALVQRGRAQGARQVLEAMQRASKEWIGETAGLAAAHLHYVATSAVCRIERGK